MEKKVQSRSDVYSTLGRVVMVICQVRGALNGFMNNLARPRRPWGDEEVTGTPEQIEKLEPYLDDHRMIPPARLLCIRELLSCLAILVIIVKKRKEVILS